MCRRSWWARTSLTGVTVAHKHTGEQRTIDVAALFVFIGADAPTAWLADTLALDEKGFISTGLSVKSCSGLARRGSRPVPVRGQPAGGLRRR